VRLKIIIAGIPRICVCNDAFIFHEIDKKSNVPARNPGQYLNPRFLKGQIVKCAWLPGYYGEYCQPGIHIHASKLILFILFNKLFINKRRLGITREIVNFLYKIKHINNLFKINTPK